MTRRRAIVVVVQGLAPALLEDWTSAGHLPAFERFRVAGGYGEFRSESVPYEPPTLVTAFTGHPISEHGCYSYWTAQSADYRPRVVESHDLRKSLLWHRPEIGDRTVCVVNVFGTHPPRELPGCLITYPMQQTLHACHPKGLLKELLGSGLRFTHDVSHWFSGGPREVFAGGALEADVRRADAARHLWKTRAPDVMTLVLTAVDRLSHVYWQELEPGSPVPLADAAVFRAYRSVDRLLGELVADAGGDANVLLFSDVGFGALRRYVSVDEQLAACGLLHDEAGVTDFARTVAYESVQGTHGVNVNLRGRQSLGTVTKDDYERVRTDIARAISAATNPFTGLPLVKRVLPREELYSGPALEDAPDLILEPADDRYLPLGEPRWARHVSRHLQSGWHRRETVWGGLGPAFAGTRSRQGSAIDVAPTILRMLELPVPPDMRGRPLAVDA